MKINFPTFSKDAWLAAIVAIIIALFTTINLPKCNNKKVIFITEEERIFKDTLCLKFSIINNYTKGSIKIQNIKLHTLYYKKEKENFFEKRIDLGVIAILPFKKEVKKEVEEEPIYLTPDEYIIEIPENQSQSFIVKIPNKDIALKYFFSFTFNYFDTNGTQKVQNSDYLYQITMSKQTDLQFEKYLLNNASINKLEKIYDFHFNTKTLIL